MTKKDGLTEYEVNKVEQQVYFFCLKQELKIENVIDN